MIDQSMPRRGFLLSAVAGVAGLALARTAAAATTSGIGAIPAASGLVLPAMPVRQVDALEREALLELRASGSFAQLCDWLVGRLGEGAGVARAGKLLARWLASELIIGIAAA